MFSNLLRWSNSSWVERSKLYIGQWPPAFTQVAARVFSIAIILLSLNTLMLARFYLITVEPNYATAWRGWNK